MKEKDLFSVLRKHQHWAKQVTPESDHAKFPQIRHGGIESYQRSFSCLLGQQTLTGLVQNWQHRNEKVLAADLFGYGYIFAELPVDYGLAFLQHSRLMKKWFI